MPRHKKNAELHSLEGTFRKDRHGNEGYDETAIAEMRRVVPDCPPTISTEYARGAWDSVVPPLVRTGRVAEEDLYVLETAFRSLDDAETYAQKIKLMESDDPRISTFASLVKNYRQQFIDTIRKFGATSQDRLALGAVLAGMKKKAPLANRMTE